MSDYGDPFESPYLKRLRVWKERAREAALQRAKWELECQWQEKREADMARQYEKWKASVGI